MKYILLIFAIFFSACSVKEYAHTQSKIIIIKSPKLKFADVGYIRNSGKKIELELFVAGKVIEKISVNHLICTNGGCMSKGGFNDDYLNSSYPDEILQNILLARPIYNAKEMIKTQDGFEQYIQNKKVDIKYVVASGSTYFKDRKNNILFKIRDTK